MNPWLGLALLLAANGLWLLFVRALGHRGFDSESTRKLFHSGSGALLLAMPVLFGGAIAPVLIWGLLGSVALGLLMLLPELRGKLAGNVYEVSRISYGDLYFVIGVMLLYFFAAPTYYTYAVPLTMLAFADALSAIVGKRFGRHKFEAVEGRKSIEGSLAFFSIAFIAVIAWSPLLPEANPLQIALIAVILGLTVMLLEAISWRGLDNLLIPLGGFILLRAYLMMDLRLLLMNLAAITLLVAFVFAWRRRSTLTHSALITGALFGYLAWTVAGGLWDPAGAGLIGLAWLGPPLILFIVFNVLFVPEMIEEHHETHNVDAVFGATVAGALWLYLGFYFDRPDFVFPYAASFACVAFNVYFERRLHRAHRPGGMLAATLAAAALMLACAIGMLELIDYELDGAKLLQLYLAAGVGLLLAAGVRLAAGAVFKGESGYRWRWHVRGLAAVLGSLVAALPLFDRPPSQF